MSKLEVVEETPTRPSEPEFHPADLWRILVQHRWLVVGSLVVSLATATIAAYLTTPMFRATTLITLEQQREDPLDIAASVPRQRSADIVSIETESRLLRGRDVLERVVRKLGLAEQGREGAESAAATPASVSPPSEVDPVTRAAMGLQAHIEIRPVRGTSLLEVHVTAHSAKKAADLANAVTEAYIGWKLESRFRLLGQASQFLTTQIAEAKSTLAQSEERLLAFSRRKDILSADPQSNVALTKLEALGRDLAAATADRISKEAREAELRNARSETLAESVTTGPVPQLRADQARLEREYQDKLGLFKPDWPAMQQLKAQIEKGRQNLDVVVEEAVRKVREAAHAEVLSAQRREDLIRTSLQTQRSQAMSLNADAVEYSNLKVETDTQRALVDNLLKRQAEIQVLTRVEGERVSNVRIVERALPPGSRFRPSYRLNGLVGLACGVLFGVALAIAAEYVDRSLRTPEQVSRYVKLPVLGIIPAAPGSGTRFSATASPSADVSSGERSRAKVLGAKAPKTALELLSHTLSRSTLAESYRAFRTSLLLSTVDRPRSVIVTSAVPFEGKTTTATNLAVVLSQLGKKVLLVDADLHRSRLHEVFHVSNAVGLVSVLTGHSAQEAVHETEIPGLCILPAGPTSPNPSGLLSSDRMRRFLDGALTKYDFVVLDTPPVLVLADAVLLGNLTDGIILVVRAGKTPRDQVVRARDELLRSNGRILGVLLNALRDPTGDISYRGRYGSEYYSKEAKVVSKTALPPIVET